MIVLCAVLVGGAALAFSLHQQKQYTASSSLLFSNNEFDQEIFGSTRLFLLRTRGVNRRPTST